MELVCEVSEQLHIYVGKFEVLSINSVHLKCIMSLQHFLFWHVTDAQLNPSIMLSLRSL